MKEFYDFGYKEKFIVFLTGILIVTCFAYFFYRSFLAVPVLLPLMFVHFKMTKKRLILKKSEELRSQFKEMIEMVAGNLRAGYSVENAFLETGKEMSRREQTDIPIVRMISFIKRGLQNNIPLDMRLKEAGVISKIQEIIEFADVFGVAKNSGGNTIDCIGQFAAMIGDKIETEKEIKVTLSARLSEQKIMNIVPFIILLYLDITSPGFFTSLYHNVSGVITMTICLLLYLVAYWLATTMIKIEI